MINKTLGLKQYLTYCLKFIVKNLIHTNIEKLPLKLNCIFYFYWRLDRKIKPIYSMGHIMYDTETNLPVHNHNQQMNLITKLMHSKIKLIKR